MKLHLPSVFVSLGVVALVALLSSQALTPVGGYRIEYMPHPRDMRTIEEGQLFAVPVGKIFVVTGLGTAVNGSPILPMLRIDGSPKLTASTNDGSSVVHVPAGLIAHGNQTIDVVAGGGGSTYAGRVYGYLANE